MKRIAVAEDFLREAVYRSRARQASPLPAAGADLADGRCGLGKAPSGSAPADAGAHALFAKLWPEGLDEIARARVHEVEERWIREQDGLDRKRNHFLKDFRGRHGFDRSAYSPELLAAFESGLAAINDQESEARRRAAIELLGDR